MKPEMKAFGFIVDVNLFKVGNMIREKKCFCKIMNKNFESQAIQEIALRENLIFITKNMAVFKAFPSQRKCFVNFKFTPECKPSHPNHFIEQYQVLNEFFKFE